MSAATWETAKGLTWRKVSSAEARRLLRLAHSSRWPELKREAMRLPGREIALPDGRRLRLRRAVAPPQPGGHGSHRGRSMLAPVGGVGSLPDRRGEHARRKQAATRDGRPHGSDAVSLSRPVRLRDRHRRHGHVARVGRARRRRQPARRLRYGRLHRRSHGPQVRRAEGGCRDHGLREACGLPSRAVCRRRVRRPHGPARMATGDNRSLAVPPAEHSQGRATRAINGAHCAKVLRWIADNFADETTKAADVRSKWLEVTGTTPA